MLFFVHSSQVRDQMAVAGTLAKEISFYIHIWNMSLNTLWENHRSFYKHILWWRMPETIHLSTAKGLNPGLLLQCFPLFKGILVFYNFF